jgi:hypothetical protein
VFWCRGFESRVSRSGPSSFGHMLAVYLCNRLHNETSRGGGSCSSHKHAMRPHPLPRLPAAPTAALPNRAALRQQEVAA